MNGLEADIRFWLPTGEEKRYREKIPVSGKSNARRWAEEREAELVREAREARAAGPKQKPSVVDVPTVAEFKKQFMTYSKTNNRPSTVCAKEWMMRLHIVPFFGEMRLDAIGPADIEAYKALKLEEKQNKKSINNHLAALRKLLNLANEYRVINQVPKVRGFKGKVDLIAEDEFLTFEETDRFLQAAAPEWKVFLVTALKTGLRLGELLALKWQDVDLVAGQLVVRRTLWRDQEGPPKGGRHRTVPLSDVAISTLKGHRHLKGDYVFCDAAGTRMTHSMLKDTVPATCKKAGLAKRITTHGLRHTFASHLVIRGKSLKAVQELLGHESIEMTLRYSHLTPDVRREAVQALDDAPPAPPRNVSGEK